MKKRIVFLLTLFTVLGSYAQGKKAYALYTSEGKKTNFSKLVKKAVATDLILFGEIHNNPIAHWLELELATELSTQRELVFGAEMFEVDQQRELNLYLQDSIIDLWSNYETDYRPLVELAKKTKRPFLATNLPKIYAKLVYEEGFEPLQNLVEDERQYMAPQPIPFDPELSQYKKMLTLFSSDHCAPELVKAQAMKDATMAHFILENHEPGSLFFHVNGSYHSDFKEGIMWYTERRKPTDFTTLTITTVEQDSLDALEVKHEGRADIIICVPSNMTKTY